MTKNIFKYRQITIKYRRLLRSSRSDKVFMIFSHCEGRSCKSIGLLLIILNTFILLSSCAHSISMPESADQHIIQNVPFYPQEAYQCGPASLAGVLNHWRVPVKPDDIAKDIFSKNARGTLSIDMVIYAQKKGLSALQYKGSLEDLKKNIDAGYPLIVLVDYGISFYQANHFMVVVGYNGNAVRVNSGKDKNIFIPNKDFLKVWKKADYWTLLIKK
jgi:predicted double-glycine peptidase